MPHSLSHFDNASTTTMSNVREFGAAGDGKIDDTPAIMHALADGDGTLEFPPGDYLLTRTVEVALADHGRFGIDGSGGTAKIIMAGEGPAFHLVGTHDKTADPTGFKPAVWARERMPTARHIEIEGRHPRSAGFLLEGTMQAMFAGVLLRGLDDGIRVHGRARNLLISHCHIYNNRGVGVFLDRVNLHQAVITGSHISYCLRAGIKIVGSEIRNLQITGNDIEYNYDPNANDAADVYIDSTADGSSVREGTIVGNTIQAKYSPGGANVRLVGRNATENHRAGMFTISDNLIGSQEINVHLVACRGVVVSGNVIYSGHRRNVEVDGSRNIVLAANGFEHNPDYGEHELCTGVRLADSHDCTLSGSILHDCQAGEHTVAGAVPLSREGLLEIIRCRRVNINGCQVLDGQPFGLLIDESDLLNVSGTSILETRPEQKTRAAIRLRGAGRGNLITANTLGKGTEDAILRDPSFEVELKGNLIVEHSG
ncbi:MAG TPA: right-handed parallel beta-helix repeat-containing protein [Pirellulales bacterium]|nr:right-handed parallel beta-helix repeat-containing protein [Pirellulales bacterium]